jgi:hypothetical protein
MSTLQRHAGRKEVLLQSLLTLALDIGEWQPSHPCLFSTGDRKSITH